MDYNINPLSDRVIIEAAETAEVSVGGIILPDTAQEKPQRGKVVAVGPGRITDSGTLVEPSVNVGDEVLYGKYSGTEINIDGSNLLIVHENDIMAKL